MKNILYILCGPPGCGKSTWALNFLEENKNDCVIVSRDAIRFNLLDDKDNYFSKEKEVLKIFYDKIQNALDSGIKYVIADATHNTRKSRMNLLNNLYLYYTDIIPVNFNTSLDQCLKNNTSRSGRALVPEEYIKKAYSIHSNPIDDNYNYFKILEVYMEE